MALPADAAAASRVSQWLYSARATADGRMVLRVTRPALSGQRTLTATRRVDPAPQP